MSLSTRRKLFSSTFIGSCSVLLLQLCFASQIYADKDAGNILVRDNVSQSQRQQLAGALSKISGSHQLRFDEDGVLHLGNKNPKAGSPLARALLEKAVSGAHVIIVENANNRGDVAFCSVFPGRWIR